MARNGSERALRFLRVYGQSQKSTRFDYVTIHPLADEPEILARLRMQPEQCTIVDCYWALGDAVVFVGVLASPDADPRVSYSPRTDDPIRHAFTVWTRQSPLTSAIYEEILARLDAWFGAHEAALPSERGVIAREDLGVAR